MARHSLHLSCGTRHSIYSHVTVFKLNITPLLDGFSFVLCFWCGGVFGGNESLKDNTGVFFSCCYCLYAEFPAVF